MRTVPLFHSLSRLWVGAALLLMACGGTPPAHTPLAGEAVPEEYLVHTAAVVTRSMGEMRAFHTATLLPSGEVLVAGGNEGSVGTAQLYSPATAAWRSTGSLLHRHYSHTATLLPSGQVLLAAGGGDWSVTAELYDPATGTWSATGNLSQARMGHTATLLPSGQVLVVGGFSPAYATLASAELYDPATGTWSATGSLSVARGHHTATLLPSGKVLVVGGFYSEGQSNQLLDSAELYDPVTGTWSTTRGLSQARGRHTATLLPSGKVLVSEGAVPSGETATSTLYDPATGSWSPGSTPSVSRIMETATLLPSGVVLYVGGPDYGSSAMVKYYNLATETWSTRFLLEDDPLQLSDGARATLLPSGGVLVTGGSGNRRALSVEVFQRAPTAQPGTVTTLQDTNVQLTVQASDEDGDPLTYTVVTPPASGRLFDVGSTFHYWPARGFTGEDSFTYKVSDGTLESSVATVSIRVDPAPPPEESDPACSAAPGGSWLWPAVLGLLLRRRRE